MNIINAVLAPVETVKNAIHRHVTALIIEESDLPKKAGNPYYNQHIGQGYSCHMKTSKHNADCYYIIGSSEQETLMNKREAVIEGLRSRTMKKIDDDIDRLNRTTNVNRVTLEAVISKKTDIRDACIKEQNYEDDRIALLNGIQDIRQRFIFTKYITKNTNRDEGPVTRSQTERSIHTLVDSYDDDDLDIRLNSLNVPMHNLPKKRHRED